jgi:hypothetical protein
VAVEIRCTCRRAPLLAIGDRNRRTGQGYIHVRVVKSGVVYSDVVVESGVARIRCRECAHFTTVRINRAVAPRQEPLPEGISLPEPMRARG